MDRTFAVLGSGNGGRAFCGQLAGKGYPVTLYEPLGETADYIELCKEPTLYLNGSIECGGRLKNVTADMGEALADAQVLFVVVPAFAHEPIFAKMIPHLRDGHVVIIVPGNYGSFRLRKMMRNAGAHADITIGETVSLPYACRISDCHGVTVHKCKKRLKLAASPMTRVNNVLDLMNDIFDGYVDFFVGSNALEIALDNLNFTLHPLPVLLNYGDIERRPESFRHYIDGLTPLISEKMADMDKERLDIGAAYGLDLMPTLHQLKIYYGENSASTYYEYVHGPDSPYRDIVGHNVRSRYLTEDIPYLVVPGMNLAKAAGVPTPIIELVIKLASELHDTDYASVGTSLSDLGIDGLRPQEIVNLAYGEAHAIAEQVR